MTIYELIEKRRSVRVYREDPIPEESITRILNAMRLAPSAHNAQAYKFILVKDKGIKKQLAEACSSQRFIAEAPVIFVGVATMPEDIQSSGIAAGDLDIAIAFDHLSLAAVEESLGTCWIGSFSQDEVKKILSIPEKHKVVAVMPLGIPYDDPGVKSRKSVKELFCSEMFSED